MVYFASNGFADGYYKPAHNSYNINSQPETKDTANDSQNFEIFVHSYLLLTLYILPVKQETTAGQWSFT